MNKEKLKTEICRLIDSLIYIPFKQMGIFKGTDFGYKKELLKLLICEEIDKYE